MLWRLPREAAAIAGLASPTGGMSVCGVSHGRLLPHFAASPTGGLGAALVTLKRLAYFTILMTSYT